MDHKWLISAVLVVAMAVAGTDEAPWFSARPARLPDTGSGFSARDRAATLNGQ